MGVGIYRAAKGKFDLVLSVRYNASLAEMNQWRQAFEYASQLLFDATDGQHQFGNLYVYNDDASNTRDTADAYLFASSGISHVTGYANLGQPGDHIELGQDESFKPFVIVHEFGHYGYGLYDEYIQLDGLNPPPAICISPPVAGGAAANACIMEAAWQDGDQINPADGSLIVGRVSEFCSQRDPEVLGPGYHSHLNLQHQVHGHSCWNEMVLAGPANAPGVTFDLVLPFSAADLPLEDTVRADADPINWVVLGQQQRFMLILDRSGSMAGNKLDDTKIGASFWADASISGDRLGVISYSHTVSVDYVLQAIQDDSDRAAARAAIQALTADGWTAIGDALRTGLNIILGDIAGASDRGKNIIVLVTDGYHNSGESPEDVLPDLIDNGVQVHTIGVGASVNGNLLAEIAHRTGGEYYAIDPDPAVQPTAIRDTLIEIEGIAHGGGLVEDIAGSTNPGLRDATVYIEPGSQMATFTLSWDNPRDQFSLELVSPDGNVISLKELPPNVRPVTSEGNPYLGFQVTKPLEGTWRLIVTPEKVLEKASYRLFTFSQNPLINGALISSPWVCKPGLSQTLQLRCYFEHPLTGLDVKARIHKPGGSVVALEFSDDGNKELGDVLPGDGIYSSVYRAIDRPGLYTIEAIVESDGKSATYASVGESDAGQDSDGYRQVPPFRRKFRRTIIVGQMPVKIVACKPDQGEPGEKMVVALSGRNTHFKAGGTDIDFGKGIEVGEVKVFDKHTVEVEIYIAKEAQPGPRTVTVTTSSYRERVEVEAGFQVVGNLS